MTQKNYYAVWKLFNKFFVRLDEKPLKWEDRIILFAGYLADQNKKPSTIKSYVSGIKAVLQSNDIEVSEDRYLLNSITRACRYTNDTIQMKIPIQRGLVWLLL